MEARQILWRDVKGPAKQTGAKKQMNQHRKHSVSKKSNKLVTTKLVGPSNFRTKSTNSCRNGFKSPQKSFGNVDSRLTASMQVIGRPLNPDQVRRSPSSLVKKNVMRRPHTSLGFTWNKSSAVDSLGTPQGFDIAGYVQRRGTAQGIQIGINGRPVNDEYFQTYLEKCERELGEHGEGCSSDSDEEFDLSYLGTVSEGKLLQRQVPLCWEDQLKIAEVSRLN